ncbi:hypothetical protein FEK35_29660 [Nocardia cyriacigeorgica]|uniref:Uncharacterized protein n=1 Tax=Nocardia cyriacigeorgica TaxID=135487 RepID=A0A5R8P5G6_9NOCA|nr:hypothetical protein [Nocardia cyriacigeorgica]TLF93559.1 hypothetical protein FEK35_29660 [Nocardia cyriacigeorgica]
MIVIGRHPWGVDVEFGDGTPGFMDNLKTPSWVDDGVQPEPGEVLTVVVVDDLRTPMRVSALASDKAVAARGPDEKTIELRMLHAQYHFRWSRRLGARPPWNVRQGEIQDFLEQSISTRRVDVSLPWGASLALYLHWSDGTDLDRLDFKISAGLPYRSEFDRAIVTTDMPFTCRSCHSRFLVLTLEPAVSLADDMVPRYRAHRFIDHSPGCGTRWNAGVVEIIQEVEGVTGHCPGDSAH